MAAPDALSIKEPCDWSVAIRRLTFDDRPSTSFCALSQPDCASTAALTTINGLSPERRERHRLGQRRREDRELVALALLEPRQ